MFRVQHSHSCSFRLTDAVAASDVAVTVCSAVLIASPTSTTRSEPTRTSIPMRSPFEKPLAVTVSPWVPLGLYDTTLQGRDSTVSDLQRGKDAGELQS